MKLMQTYVGPVELATRDKGKVKMSTDLRPFCMRDCGRRARYMYQTEHGRVLDLCEECARNENPVSAV